MSNARGRNEEAYEYEQQRLANNAKIKDKLKSLKLPSLNNSVPPRQPNSSCASSEKGCGIVCHVKTRYAGS
jgi:hypothetical protein